jgi:hypothetical protein
VDRAWEGEIWKSEQKDGKKTTTFLDVRMESRMYCAVDGEGTPRCTEWFVRKCSLNERQLEHRDGKIVVVEVRTDEDKCFDRVIAPGVYTLFEEGFLQSLSQTDPD